MTRAALNVFEPIICDILSKLNNALVILSQLKYKVLIKVKLMITKIAVVDDDFEMGSVVKDLLTIEGYKVAQFTSAADALVQFKTDLPHIVITDHRMKDIDGLMLLKKLQSDYPTVTTIMMTAFGSIETAIEAMKAGAYHYIVKPFKNDEMILTVNRAVQKVRLTNDNMLLRKELTKSFSIDDIIGKSSAMTSIFELIKLISSASSNVLITGESGSGKEVIARAIHNSGLRKKKPFIALNCAAIPEQLLETELFGHVKGSFTGATNDKKGLFEEANDGTLFLDEIGDLSLPLQAKLLRVLQEKQIRAVGGNTYKDINIRVIAATHQDLRKMVNTGAFREDLFYRLNVIPVRVPALRERVDDIPLLVESFIRKFAAQNHSSIKTISPEAMAVLLAYRWPGNVRELENVIERAIVLNPGDRIEKTEILDSALIEAKSDIEQLHSDKPSIEKLEERYIKMILAEVDDNKDAAAKILGISKRTLYRKEVLYGLIDSSKSHSTSSFEAGHAGH
jgi:DNA-binding NtrC family response regulator